MKSNNLQLNILSIHKCTGLFDGGTNTIEKQKNKELHSEVSA